MSLRAGSALPVVSIMLLITSCGKNADEPEEQETLVQGGLEALAIDASHVRFEWSPVEGIADSAVHGYVLTWTGGSDTVSPSVLAYLVGPLPQGEVAFTVTARLTGTRFGPAATIRWAPAARFDAPLALREYQSLDLQRAAGLDLGGATGDPALLAVDATNATVAATIDLYLFGGEGMVSEPLQLRSASILVGTWHATAFSTVSHGSPSLDFPLERFPDAATFTLSSVQVQENTIYYARYTGTEGGTHYIRIHAGTVSGAGRDRSLLLRFSLQRVAGLLYAALRAPASRPDPGA